MSVGIAGRNVALPYVRVADAPTKVEVTGGFPLAAVSLTDFTSIGWEQNNTHPTLPGDRLLVGVQVSAAAYTPASGATGSWEVKFELGVGASGSQSVCTVLVAGTFSTTANASTGALASVDLTVPVLVPGGQEIVTRTSVRSRASAATSMGAGCFAVAMFVDPTKLL